jgi:hypothetical protein
VSELSDYKRCVSDPLEEKLRARIRDLEAENARLLEALEPFAAAWAQLDEDNRIRRAWRVQITISTDDLRRARKARAALSGRTGT